MRALCLGGGAFRGYYQLPVIEHLLSIHKYDYIYGVSVGAMHGVMIAQNKFYLVQQFWENIERTSDALSLRWWWPFSGIYSLNPVMKEMNQHIFLEDLKIPFAAGVLSITDGNYYHLSSPLMSSSEDLRGAVIASGSIPGLMTLPTISINGKPHTGTDGGFKNSIPIPPPGKYTDIDIVICTPIKHAKASVFPSTNSINQTTRTVQILQDELCKRDLAELQSHCSSLPNISIYHPSQDLGPSFKVTRELKQLRWYSGFEAIKNPIRI